MTDREIREFLVMLANRRALSAFATKNKFVYSTLHQNKDGVTKRKDGGERVIMPFMRAPLIKAIKKWKKENGVSA